MHNNRQTSRIYFKNASHQRNRTSVRHKLNVLNTYAHSRTRKTKTSAYYGHKSLLKCTHVYMYETAYVQLLQRVAACRLTTTTKIIAICNRTIIAGQNKLYFFISICKFVDANHNITKRALSNRSKTEKSEICAVLRYSWNYFEPQRRYTLQRLRSFHRGIKFDGNIILI